MSLFKRITQKLRPRAYIAGLEVKTHSYRSDYTVKKEHVLGEGMNGKVRVCVSKTTNERFAIKMLADNDSARREVELQIICSADHDGIAKIHDVYSNDIKGKSTLVIVMECVTGEDLFDRISRRSKQPLTEKRVGEIAKEVLSAIEHIHSLNIAHRDIKPENIMLSDKTDSAHIKLIDFGFAKACLGSDSLSTPCYTPYYAAPEIFSDSSYDKSCDAWSTGVIVYILMSGYPPFTSSKKNARQPLSRGMKNRIRNGEYVFPERYWKKASPECVDFIRSLLQPDTKKRMTVEDALKHSWITDVAASRTEPLLPGSSVKSDKADDVKATADGPSPAQQPDGQQPTSVKKEVSQTKEPVAVLAAANTTTADVQRKSSTDGAGNDVTSMIQPMSTITLINPMLARRKAAQSHSETTSVASATSSSLTIDDSSQRTTPTISVSSSTCSLYDSDNTDQLELQLPKLTVTLPSIQVSGHVSNRRTHSRSSSGGSNVFLSSSASTLTLPHLPISKPSKSVNSTATHDSGFSSTASSESIQIVYV